MTIRHVTGSNTILPPNNGHIDSNNLPTEIYNFVINHKLLTGSIILTLGIGFGAVLLTKGIVGIAITIIILSIGATIALYLTGSSSQVNNTTDEINTATRARINSQNINRQNIQENRSARPCITISLQNARQYDFDQTPAACTFHAIAAMRDIPTRGFPRFAQLIQENSSAELSRIQREIITNGLASYNRALAINPGVREGVDLNQLIEMHGVIPPGLRFEQVQIATVTNATLNQRTTDISEILFHDNQGITKVSWIKNSNDESFSVIRFGNEAIIFDSHINEMILATGKEELSRALYQKLAPFIGSMNTIEYALGEYQAV